MRNPQKSFTINEGKGFQLLMPCGNVIISTQFGYGNYCENQNNRIFAIRIPDRIESAEAEIAFINAKTGDWLTRQVCELAKLDDPHDDVIGWELKP